MEDITATAILSFKSGPGMSCDEEMISFTATCLMVGLTHFGHLSCFVQDLEQRQSHETQLKTDEKKQNKNKKIALIQAGITSRAQPN